MGESKHNLNSKPIKKNKTTNNKINNSQNQVHNPIMIKLINLMINKAKTKGMHSINYNRKKRKLLFSEFFIKQKGYAKNE